MQFYNDRVSVSADSLEPLWINPCVTRRSEPMRAYVELAVIYSGDDVFFFYLIRYQGELTLWTLDKFLWTWGN